MYWHGILDYSNRDNRRLAELGAIHEKTRCLSDAAGSRYEAAFGVIRDYDNIWDAKFDRWHQRFERESEAGIFQAAQLSHTPMDYVYLTETVTVDMLKKYPVLFYPHAVILTKERTALLEEYAEGGGTLVLGCRTGYKDLNGKCPMIKLPGLLRRLSGADVIDYTFVAPGDAVAAVDWEGAMIEAPVFNDILEPLENAAVLGTYTNNYYAGKGALIYNEYGKGKVYYFGGAFNRGTANVFLKKLRTAGPYRDIIELPESCELAVRRKGDDRYIFVLNYAKSPNTIIFKREVQDMYTKKPVTGEVELPAYGTGVYRI
jgi:beta-galactosidase